MRTDIAILVGTFLSFLAWGFYSAIFFATMWVNRVQGRSKLSSPFMLAIMVIFVINFLLTFTMTVPAFDEFINGATMHYLPYNTISTLNDLGLIVAMIIADGTVAWRMYIVWARDKRVLALALVLLAGVVAASVGVLQNDFSVIAQDVKLAKQGAPDDFSVIDASAAGYQRWLSAQLLVSLAFNLVATGMIVGRLWWANTRMKRTSTRPNDRIMGGYIKIIIALVESGAIYTAGLTGNILVYFLDAGTAQGLFIYVMPRLVGLAPTLLLLQQSLGYFQPGELTSRMTSRISKLEMGTTVTKPEVKVTVSQLHSSDTDTYPFSPEKVTWVGDVAGDPSMSLDSTTTTVCPPKARRDQGRPRAHSNTREGRFPPISKDF